MNQLHLQAFHDEFTALVRSGVPLERLMGTAGRELGNRAGSLMQEVGARLEAGQTIEQVLAAPDLKFPPAYQALVRVGIRTGRLPAALETLADQMRDRSDTRQLAAAAMVYPMMVVAVAYCSFLFLLFLLTPRLLTVYREMQFDESPLAPLLWLRQTAPWWTIPVPIAMLLAGWYVWHRTWQSAFDRRKSHRSSISSSLTRAIRFDQANRFCLTLAQLLKQQVPYPEALQLAGATTGNIALEQQTEVLATQISQGDGIPDDHRRQSTLPPLVLWTLSCPSTNAQRIQALECLGERYRIESDRLLQRCSTGLPILIGAGLGGAAALLTCTVIFTPVVNLYFLLGAFVS